MSLLARNIPGDNRFDFFFVDEMFFRQYFFDQVDWEISLYGYFRDQLEKAAEENNLLNIHESCTMEIAYMGLY